MSFEPLIRSRNDVMEIAEEIAPFFRSRMTDENGNPARYMSVENVQYDELNLGIAIEYDLSIQYLSDQGDFNQEVTMREYRDLSTLEDELDRFSEIENRCIFFKDLDPIPMISINHQKKYVIYEKVEGFSLNQLAMPEVYKDVMMGRICAILQGDTITPLDESVIREYLIFLLMNLPFTDEEKESLSTLLEPHFERFTGAKGGYITNTTFDANDLLFTPLNVDDLSLSTITNGEVFHCSVNVFKPESLINDRFGDIANYFSQNAFIEFIQTGDVEKTRKRIKDFLVGYRAITNTINLTDIEGLYPRGITLDIHFLAAQWLLEAEKITTTTSQEVIDLNEDVLRYSYFLLLKNPFSII